VATLAPDVERIFLGAGDGWVGNVRVFAMTVEAAFGFDVGSFNVVARLAAKGFAVLLMGKGDGRLFWLVPCL
jgi:hypothetical protein